MATKLFWATVPEGWITTAHNRNLRVGHQLDNGRYAYFVHKAGEYNQQRGEAETLDKAKEAAVSLACYLDKQG